MAKATSAQKVTDFLSFTIGMFGNMTVDEAGYIRHLDGALLTRQYKGKDTPILVYRDPLPKERFYLLNPFAGALRSEPPLKWYLNFLTTNVTLIIVTAIRNAIGVSLRDMGESLDEPHLAELESSNAVMNILSGKTSNKKSMASEIDRTTYNEVQAIIESPEVMKSLFDFQYRGATLSTSLFSSLLKEGEAFFEERQTKRQIRPKTKRVFIKAVENMLGINDEKDLSRFTAEAADDETPRIGSFYRCFFKVMREISPKLERVYPHGTIDMETFAQALDNLPGMSIKAKAIADSYFDAAPRGTVAPAQNTVPQAFSPPQTVSQNGPSVPSTGQQSAYPAGPMVPQNPSTIPAPTVPPSPGYMHPPQPFAGMPYNPYPQAGYYQQYPQAPQSPFPPPQGGWGYQTNQNGWASQQPPMSSHYCPPGYQTPTFR